MRKKCLFVLSRLRVRISSSRSANPVGAQTHRRSSSTCANLRIGDRVEAKSACSRRLRLSRVGTGRSHSTPAEATGPGQTAAPQGAPQHRPRRLRALNRGRPWVGRRIRGESSESDISVIGDFIGALEATHNRHRIAPTDPRVPNARIEVGFQRH